jgi:AcrR family transcriptional regulator
LRSMAEKAERGAGKRSRRLHLTRAERSELVKKRLFDAAVKVVGEIGYAEATVSRITRMAGVAQGTFYNHFPNRQDLLDQLLPTVGAEMLSFIRGRVDSASSEIEKESARFRGFFEFLMEVPEFMRILNEADLFAPKGYAKHIELISTNYFRALTKGKVGESELTPAELEVVIHIMMGARSYLSHHFSYTNGKVHMPPPHVFTAYEKLFKNGLFGTAEPKAKNWPRQPRSRVRGERPS